MVDNIEKCKTCMSINVDLKCDSVDTPNSNPNLNFPCRYYIDRDTFTKSIVINIF